MKRSAWLAITLGAALMHSSGAVGVLAKQPSHTHLTVSLKINPSQPGAAGDMVGVYSFEIIPCETAKLSQSLLDILQTAANRLSDVIIAPAHANHRDHFDRIGARQSLIRVPLGQVGLFNLGDVDVTRQDYCHIRLTFARLPMVTGPKPLPALETSVFMNRPAGLKPLALPYSVPFELPLAQPWRPSLKGDALRITLDPAAANSVLRDTASEDGTLGQRVISLWRKTADVRFSVKP